MWLDLLEYGRMMGYLSNKYENGAEEPYCIDCFLLLTWCKNGPVHCLKCDGEDLTHRWNIVYIALSYWGKVEW